MEPLILTMADTVEYKLMQSRIAVFERDQRNRSNRTRKGWDTRRAG